MDSWAWIQKPTHSHFTGYLQSLLSIKANPHQKSVMIWCSRVYVFNFRRCVFLLFLKGERHRLCGNLLNIFGYVLLERPMIKILPRLYHFTGKCSAPINCHEIARHITLKKTLTEYAGYHCIWLHSHYFRISIK